MTRVTVEVLTRGPREPVFSSLPDVAFRTTEGDASGAWDARSREVSSTEMRRRLLAQGSDPEFLFPEDATTVDDDERVD